MSETVELGQCCSPISSTMLVVLRIWTGSPWRQVNLMDQPGCQYQSETRNEGGNASWGPEPVAGGGRAFSHQGREAGYSWVVGTAPYFLRSSKVRLKGSASIRWPARPSTEVAINIEL